MNVTEHRTWRHPCPLLSVRGANEIVDVEVVRRHVQLSLVVAPRVARPIRVNLDAESIGIGQIHCFADKVIRHSRVRTDRAEVRNEAAEGCTIWKQDRKVIKPEQTSPRHRARSGELVEMHYLPVFAVRTKTGVICGPLNETKSED